MLIIRNIFIVLVAVEALFIMFLEIFLTQTKLARSAFALSAKYLAQHEARVAMGNQGLYNGFTGVGILVSLFVLSGSASTVMLLLFTGFVAIAAIWGAITVTPKIIFTQGLLAIIAFVLILVKM